MNENFITQKIKVMDELELVFNENINPCRDCGQQRMELEYRLIKKKSNFTDIRINLNGLCTVFRYI